MVVQFNFTRDYRVIAEVTIRVSMETGTKMNDIEIRKRTVQLVEYGYGSEMHVCGGVLLDRRRTGDLCFLTVSWPAVLHMMVLCDTGMRNVQNSQMGSFDSKWAFTIPGINSKPQNSVSPHFIRWENGNDNVQNSALGELPSSSLSCIPSYPRFLKDIQGAETFSVATVSPISCSISEDAANTIGTPLCLCDNLRIISIPSESHIMEFKIDSEVKLPPCGTDMQVTGCPVFDYEGRTVALAYYANWKDRKIFALNLERYRAHMEIQPCW